MMMTMDSANSGKPKESFEEQVQDSKEDSTRSERVVHQNVARNNDYDVVNAFLEFLFAFHAYELREGLKTFPPWYLAIFVIEIFVKYAKKYANLSKFSIFFYFFWINF